MARKPRKPAPKKRRKSADLRPLTPEEQRELKELSLDELELLMWLLEGDPHVEEPLLLWLLGQQSRCSIAARQVDFRSSSALVDAICSLLTTTRGRTRKYACTYALSWSHQLAAVPTLIALLLDDHEWSQIRGQAAEGLGDVLQSRSRREVRDGVQALRTILEETRSRRLQFWTAFSLGKLRVRAALPRLRELARGDRSSSVEGLWSVAEEAEDAIAGIEGRRVPDRVPRPRTRR